MADDFTEEKPTLEIIKFEPVILWSLNIQSDICAICRNNIMDMCIECTKSHEPNFSIEKNEVVLMNIPDCKISWGECNHAFHFHCINRWLKNRPLCPLDQKEWHFKRN